MNALAIRVARPDDYDAIAAVADDWWGRPGGAALSRLFLDHFHGSSRVVEDDHGLAGFRRRLGFAVDGPVPDYNGPGRPMMVFRRFLTDDS
ncbi:hypothetical protein [Parafrankia discariae]|uniref:hypothetical protein n=1 Tax=Parafrankia discariae TaxID=365528 RepID=UPI00037EE551|nr:hypothetical protein [Parafrankia discariae]